MPKFDVTIVSKEYRTITIEAETAEDAKDAAWDEIDNALNSKPEDYDTEVYVENAHADAE